MRAWTKRMLRGLGWELRRLHPLPLPRIEILKVAGVKFPFWISNPHANAWWAADPLPARGVSNLLMRRRELI